MPQSLHHDTARTETAHVDVDKIRPRVHLPEPFPRAPTGKDGGIALSILIMILWCMVAIYGPLELLLCGWFEDTGQSYTFYFSMSFVLGCYGLVCCACLIMEKGWPVHMTLTFLGACLAHNILYSIENSIYFLLRQQTIWIIVMPAWLFTYFLTSKRVRNTYRWKEEDTRQDPPPPGFPAPPLTTLLPDGLFAPASTKPPSAAIRIAPSPSPPRRQGMDCLDARRFPLFIDINRINHVAIYHRIIFSIDPLVIHLDTIISQSF